MNYLIIISLSLTLFSCSKKTEEAPTETVAADYATKEAIVNAKYNNTNQNVSNSSTAAVVNEKDKTRSFIRTADLKFRVKNVREATNEIENITSLMNGFVTHTNLESSIIHTSTDEISNDSVLETTHFSVKNNIELRIPNTKLDTTLRSLSKIIDFLDYRKIDAEDVAIQILSNNLTQQRIGEHEKRLINAIDNKGKKLVETTTAEENLVNKIEQRDNALINNLNLEDKINFSTIKLEIYQRETINRIVLENQKNISSFTPKFTHRITSSFNFGIHIITEIFFFIINIWPLAIILVLFYFIRKSSVKNHKK